MVRFLGAVGTYATVIAYTAVELGVLAAVVFFGMVAIASAGLSVRTHRRLDEHLREQTRAIDGAEAALTEARRLTE